MRDVALPLVCLHGWGLNGGIWTALATDFPGRTLIAPDLPGYGGSPPVQPYTPERLADRLADLMPAACVLLGWSLGGIVALSWAARRPQQVRALILVGTTPAFVNRDDWSHGLAPEVLEGFASDLKGNWHATLLRFLALQAKGGQAAREVIGRLRATLFARGEPPTTTLAAGLELLRSVDLRRQVAKVRCPALIVHGAHDTLCPPQAGRWLAACLPRARLALHGHAAHAPFLSHPQWFTTTVKDFLAEVEALRPGPEGTAAATAACAVRVKRLTKHTAAAGKRNPAASS